MLQSPATGGNSVSSESGRGPSTPANQLEPANSVRQMAKRPADTQLTRDDLDRDDSPERQVSTPDTGPQLAAQDILARRTILKPRRSTPLSQSTASSNSPFAALLTKPLIAPSTPQSSHNLFTRPFSASPAQPSTTATSTMSSMPNGSRSTAPEVKDSYREKVASLNDSFVKHLSKLYTIDPFVSMKKNCEEYIKFIDELSSAQKASDSIGSIFPKSSAPQAVPFSKTQSAPAQPLSSTPISSTFSFGLNSATHTQASAGSTVTTVTTSSTTAPAPAFSSQSTFNFGKKLDSNFTFGSSAATTSQPPVIFGNGPDTTPIKPQFGSTISSTPMFGGFLNNSATASTSTANQSQTVDKTCEDADGDGDSEEPPKLTDAKMDEEGSIYSKNIKLFFLKDKKFESMGKGMVHVKKLSSGKNQLLVRGENALGSIWLNVLLDKTVTVKKQGKKDVQCLCFTKLPADDSNEMKYVTYLLRTMSESDADDLECNLLKLQE